MDVGVFLRVRWPHSLFLQSRSVRLAFFAAPLLLEFKVSRAAWYSSTSAQFRANASANSWKVFSCQLPRLPCPNHWFFIKVLRSSAAEHAFFITASNGRLRMSSLSFHSSQSSVKVSTLLTFPSAPSFSQTLNASWHACRKDSRHWNNTIGLPTFNGKLSKSKISTFSEGFGAFLSLLSAFLHGSPAPQHLIFLFKHFEFPKGLKQFNWILHDSFFLRHLSMTVDILVWLWTS